jgi:hypothetical protein
MKRRTMLERERERQADRDKERKGNIFEDREG